MSDEETHIVQTEEGQMLTAEYRDGQLQIVEVTPFDKGNESNASSGEQTKYLQVIDSNKGLVQLDLLNFTIVKCSHDDTSYEVVGSSTENGDTTLTCVLSSEDIEENDESRDSYVVVNSAEGNDPVVFLQSSLQQINTKQTLKKVDKKKTPTPTEILEKAKALQKAKALLKAENSSRYSNHSRKRKSDLPPPMELLSSPNFKLYLYSCKMCDFKCNAVKEMSKHKSTEHSGRSRGVGGRGNANLQCARCPYRGHIHSQLIKHVQEVHLAEEDDSDLKVDCEDSEAHVLVCGACGFESVKRDILKKHIEATHGVNVMFKTSRTAEESSQSN